MSLTIESDEFRAADAACVQQFHDRYVAQPLEIRLAGNRRAQELRNVRLRHNDGQTFACFWRRDVERRIIGTPALTFLQGVERSQRCDLAADRDRRILARPHQFHHEAAHFGDRDRTQLRECGALEVARFEKLAEEFDVPRVLLGRARRLPALQAQVSGKLCNPRIGRDVRTHVETPLRHDRSLSHVRPDRSRRARVGEAAVRRADPARHRPPDSRLPPRMRRAGSRRPERRTRFNTTATTTRRFPPTSTTSMERMPRRVSSTSCTGWAARSSVTSASGTWENWRKDAGKFPKSVIGKPDGGWKGERWLDVRQTQILEPIMTARLQMCKAKHFDGVDPDNMDGFENRTGFKISYNQQLAYKFVGRARGARARAHRR